MTGFVWDEDALTRAYTYCGRDPREPQDVEREIDIAYPGNHWTLDGFRAAIEAALAAVPPEARATAQVRLGEGGDYESGALAIRYTSTQTPAEVAESVARAQRYVEEGRERDRREYERLKAKFTA